MKRVSHFSSQFKRDYKRIRRDARLVRELTAVLVKLEADIPLDPKYCDHPLHNNWEGCRDCHVRPDCVLIYRKTDDGELHVLALERFASHSELFG